MNSTTAKRERKEDLGVVDSKRKKEDVQHLANETTKGPEMKCCTLDHRRICCNDCNNGYELCILDAVKCEGCDLFFCLDHAEEHDSGMESDEDEDEYLDNHYKYGFNCKDCSK